VKTQVVVRVQPPPIKLADGTPRDARREEKEKRDAGQ